MMSGCCGGIITLVKITLMPQVLEPGSGSRPGTNACYRARALIGRSGGLSAQPRDAPHPPAPRPPLPSQVALAMQKAGKSVNVGHHIPYVMCKIPGAASPAERARHPDEVARSDGKLEVDVEW